MAELLHHRRHQDGVPRPFSMIAGPHLKQSDDPWNPQQFAEQCPLQTWYDSGLRSEQSRAEQSRAEQLN